MESFIKLIISNPSVSLFILGIITSLISIYFSKRSNKTIVIETFVAYFFLFNIGIGYLYNFVLHVFFSEFTAKFIGWANSPFQLEVGFVSLGIGVAGIIAFKQNLSFRVAAFIPPALFGIGAAGGHIYQIMTANNFAPGNAGSVLFTDIFIPIIGFVFLCLQWKSFGNKKY